MYLRVHVSPSAKREFILQKTEDLLDIGVREPAERGLANERVRELVAGHLKAPISAVRLISGHTGRSKLYSIQDSAIGVE
jgi:hypothetical protein